MATEIVDSPYFDGDPLSVALTVRLTAPASEHFAISVAKPMTLSLPVESMEKMDADVLVPWHTCLWIDHVID